jgi:hypothetical protein
VVLQSFAISKAEERRAIAYLRRQPLGTSVVLKFGEKREPADEGTTVMFRVKPQEIGSAVAEAVFERP